MIETFWFSILLLKIKIRPCFIPLALKHNETHVKQTVTVYFHQNLKRKCLKISSHSSKP